MSSARHPALAYFIDTFCHPTLDYAVSVLSSISVLSHSDLRCVTYFCAEFPLNERTAARAATA